VRYRLGARYLSKNAVYEPVWHCKRIKCEAIAVTVMVQICSEELYMSLNKYNSLDITINASNKMTQKVHRDTVLFLTTNKKKR
jgi:hypothetical protein